MGHHFVKASGTTSICAQCGCISYNCRCCTKNRTRYSRWDTKARRWTDDVFRATDLPPTCDESRPVPQWVRERDA